MKGNALVTVSGESIELRMYEDDIVYRAFYLSTRQTEDLQNALSQAVAYLTHSSFPAIVILGANSHG